MSTTQIINMPIKAGNEIIAARFKYSSHEIDVMCHVLRQLQTTTGDINHYAEINMPVDVITESWGNTGRAIDYLRAAFRAIASKPFEFYAGGQYTITNLISGAMIDTRRMTATVRIDVFMLPHLVKLRKEYTSFELRAILPMDSVHAKRIYMMIAQFRATGIFCISVDDLRKRLHLEDKYSEFKDFRRRVLDVAIKEINQHSEFDCVLILEKAGRVADNLTFRFTAKPGVADIIGDDQQIKFMIKWGLSDWQIDNVLMSHLKPADIHDILMSMQIRLNDKTKKPVDNKGAYLAKLFSAAGVDMTRQQPKQQKMF